MGIAMQSDEKIDLEERRLMDKALQETIAWEAADLFRTIMRGVATLNAKSATERTLRDLHHIRVLVRCCEEFSLDQALTEAFDEVAGRDRPSEQNLLDEVARSGMRYLIERFAYDEFARARTAQREADFRRQIKLLVKNEGD